MERRQTVALIVGLVIALGLLIRWAMLPDEHSDAPAGQEATIAQSTPSVPPTEAPAESAADTPEVIESNQDASDSGIFRGRIIDAVTRQPVREFDIEFYRLRRSGNDPVPPFHSFKTKDGRFECKGVPAGVWTILATAHGYQRFELNGVTIASDTAAQEVLIPMRSGQILQGRVFDEATDDGIAGAQVSFREAEIGRYQGNFRNRVSTTSRTDGTFVLNGLPEGRVIVTAHAKNYAPGDLGLTIGNKMAPAAIGLSTGGTIAGYLAGSDGLTPVAGIISLTNLDEGSGSSMRTGEAGQFNFRQLPPARYMLSGRATGLSGDREIVISHSEQLEGIVLAMRGGHTIRGVVSGLSPEELKVTRISIYRDDEYVISQGDAVDERGAFTVSGVLPGQVRISADVSRRRNLGKTVQMPVDTDLTVNLEFPRGARLTGRVTRGGKPLSGAAVNPSLIASSAGSTKQDIYFYDTPTSANGDYVIEDLPHGEYMVRVEAYRSPTVRVAGDTVFDIDVPTAQLAGRLIEAGGKVPVVGAIVDVRPTRPNPQQPVWLSDTSDHFGQFAVRGMQPGDFVLSVYKPGYEMHRAPLSYGSTVSDLVIALRPAKGVEIKVRDASNGRAIRGLSAQEILDGQPGLFMQLNLDQNGVGYLPSGIAGSTLKFMTMGYAPITVTAWNGDGLELSLQPQATP